ncbi:hypothetical protein JCM10450v2_007736 [Rhodotorula kratochvilovae]
MAAEDADPPSQTTFTRADDFIRDAAKLTSVDFNQDPSSDDDADEQRMLNGLCAMLDEYQEQSYLLDPSLEALVSPLLSTLREQVRRPDCNLAGKRIGRLARLVYFVTKVRGAKTIVRFFPHEVSDLSLLVRLLSPASAPSTSTSSSLSTASWELRYALLLWLSVCIRVPFALALLAPGTANAIEALGLQWLERSGREGEGAQEVLGRYFARNDAPLGKLIGWCEDALQDGEKPLLALSLLASLLLVLSSASPAHITPHFPRLYALLALLPAPADGRAGAGAARMRAKLAGRVALLRVQAARDDGGEEDVPEEVEVVVGELIEGLAHPDSIPRYSSAKYLARLALVLPATFAAQVIDAVLCAFEEALAPAERESGAGEGRAQGACLAVGEMARRGVLNRLEEEKGEVVARVVECTMQALAYDHLTALHAIGSSVRDSASYVLWSLSRTLPASSLSPAQAQRLAECLLCTACLDREVSVRRAASAAFQEAVGRWGIFPHGIPILRQVDFFTVSVRHRAFLHAAVGVASFDPYRPAITAHLLGREGGTGVAHYDAEIRALAAQALGKVVRAAAEELGEEVVREQVGKLAQTKDIAKLHGLLLSLAALAEAVAELPEEKREELRQEIFTAICALHPSTRSFARNHLVLSAALLALARAAPAPSASTPALPPNWFSIVHLTCDRGEEAVHAAAGEALRAVSSAVDCSGEVNRLLAELDSRSGTRQQAAALLLGAVDYASSPVGTLAHGEKVSAVTRRLTALARREGEGKAVSIEARRNGVDALAGVLCTAADMVSTNPTLLRPALEALLAGFNDYTTDQRGDVGSWVRSATTRACATLLRAGVLQRLGREMVDGAVGAMAKMALERLDAVREVAGRAMMEVWAWQETEGAEEVLRGWEVWAGIASEERSDWRDLNWASERILPLLSVPEYRDQVLEGAVLANTAYSSATPFLDFALLLPALPSPSAPAEEPYTLFALLQALHALGKRSLASNRLFTPFLSLVASLAEAGALDEVALDESDEGAGPKVLRNLLALACAGVGKIKSAARLGAAAKVATAFLALPVVAPAAASKLPLFLAHPQPWLRQQAADELFGALSALGLVDPDAEGEEGGELERLLGETSWTAEGTQAQAERVAHLVEELVAAQ